MAQNRSRKKVAANEAAVAALVPEEERGDVAVRAQALLARNEMLKLIDAIREEQHLTKKALAMKAGLEVSSVRRLLTAKTANPTSENIFRLMGALGVRIEAVTPAGKRVSLVGGRKLAAIASR